MPRFTQIRLAVLEGTCAAELVSDNLERRDSTVVHFFYFNEANIRSFSPK